MDIITLLVMKHIDALANVYQLYVGLNRIP